MRSYMRVVMGPNACQLSVKFEAICQQAVRFFAHCQLSVEPKSQIQGLSVVSKTSLSVVSEKYG